MGSHKPVGTWENGSAKYYCIHHKKEVGHPSSECFLVKKGKGSTNKYQPYEPKNTVMPAYIREQVASALPQYASMLLTANILRYIITI